MSHTAGGILDRLRAWFPEREFFMRSQGQVRFLTITSRVQMVAAGTAACLLLGWGISMGVMAVTQYQASSERAELMSREAQVAQAETRFDAYNDDLAEITTDLEARQDFLDGLMENLPSDMLVESDADTVSDSASEAAELIGLVEESFPQAAGLARLEARQLAFVERLTRYADRRSASAEDAIRTLGLDPRMVLRSASRGQGGPLELLSANDSLDDRFERLALSLSRMTALERGLNGIPQVMPADRNSISSGFGYRRDPFTGRAAMHNGLDFRGAYGAPIHAAADGQISYVGYKAGYGRTVDISHGNGLTTRYAHMSRWNAEVGQQVEAGDIIGRIGSSGRSTGAHLHFEVRVNNRPVNPRPFLETAPDVLEEARADYTHDHDGHEHGEEAHGE